VRLSAPYSLIAEASAFCCRFDEHSFPTPSAAVACPALDGGRHPQQVVPHAVDQVLVEAAGKKVPRGRLARREVGARAGPIEGDLPQVADAGESWRPKRSNSAKFASVAPWVSARREPLQAGLADELRALLVKTVIRFHTKGPHVG
jgi:hypothetical protein